MTEKCYPRATHFRRFSALAKITAEYIGIDGQKPTAKLRSKTKIVDSVKSLADIPDWGYDGSSTMQATGHFSDLQLKPVKYVPDPLHREGDILVLCEVLNADGSVHESNTRARCRVVAEKYKSHDPWFGIEQEYTFFQGARPLGWPDSGFPAPQGGYYCGVGAHTNFSTKEMRQDGGLNVVREAMKKLEAKHDQHIVVYGAHNEERLTGLHETSPIHAFRVGDFDRGASVRIPMATINAGKGYFEDRRPAANMDPYQVCAILIETVCGS